MLPIYRVRLAVAGLLPVGAVDPVRMVAIVERGGGGLEEKRDSEAWTRHGVVSELFPANHRDFLSTQVHCQSYWNLKAKKSFKISILRTIVFYMLYIIQAKVRCAFATLPTPLAALRA